ncbi:MAG: hypothetical protein ACQET8_23100 [Bacillota bacterium]
MKSEKKQARIIISDITEKHCVPCTKKNEHLTSSGTIKTNFISTYCSTECPAGRDLKKLGDILDKPREEIKVTVKEKKTVKATKENCMDLLAQGKKNHEIAKIFGISEPNLHYKKKKWGLTGQRKAKEVVAEETATMPVIEVEPLEQDENEKDLYIKDLEEQLKQKSHIEGFNRETYQKLTEAEEMIKNLSRMVTVATEETKAIEEKYEALKQYVKVIM